MLRLIHCSDLHLKSNQEREYSLQVLQEIIQLAVRQKTDYLLCCGDIFDSFRDFQVLATDFFKEIEKLSATKVLFIWGNHELHEFKAEKADLVLPANLKIFSFEGVDFYQDDKAEFIAVLTRPSDFKNFFLPRKPRFVLSHCTLLPNIFNFYQHSETENVHALDLSFLLSFQADYYALGHIHRFLQEFRENRPFVYSGAARICRSGELIQPGVVLLEFADKIRFTHYALKSAGVFRRFEIGIFGNNDFEIDTSGWGEADWIVLSFYGVVADMIDFRNRLEQKTDEIRKKIKVRRIDYLIEKVKELKHMETNPFIQNFLKKWQRLQNEQKYPPQVLGKALEIFLRQVSGGQ